MRDIVEQLEQAAVLRRQGDPTGALRLLVRVSAATPERADLAYQTAWILDILGRDRDAVTRYRRALALDAASRNGDAPKDGTLSAVDRKGAHLGLGLVLIRMGQPTAAIDELTRAAAEYPGDVQLKALLVVAETMANRQHPAAFE